MTKPVENLNGPLFPKGFEGDDEPIDLGSYLLKTEAERKLFRVLDIRLSQLDKTDPNIPDAWYEEPGFIFARRIDDGETFEEIAEAWQDKGLFLDKRPVQTEHGTVYFLVVKKADEPQND